MNESSPVVVDVDVPVGTARFHAVFRSGEPSSWIGFEQELLDENVSVPLPHRVAWAQAHPDRRHWHVSVRSREGRAEAGAVVSVQRSRALPAWRIAEVDRVGASRTSSGREALLRAFQRIPSLVPRLLRFQLGLFSLDPPQLQRGSEILLGLGFRTHPHPRSYRHTLLLDLGPAEAELFMGLHSSARRNIRAVDKKPVSIRPIRDPDYAGRMRELLCKSFARTGKNAPRLDWARLIGFSERHPDLSRIVGLFREGAQGPEALLAYTWGCFHGDCAHYSVGASARPDDLRMPLTYGLMWDLIVWAKTGGAKVFDLGGITGAPVGAEGAVAGIARFKRYFASDEKQVGAEFVLEPNPALGSMQRAVGSAGRWAVERLAGLGRS